MKKRPARNVVNDHLIFLLQFSIFDIKPHVRLAIAHLMHTSLMTEKLAPIVIKPIRVYPRLNRRHRWNTFN